MEEAELGRGLVGSLVTSVGGVLVNTCVDTDQDEEQEQVTAMWVFFFFIGITAHFSLPLIYLHLPHQETWHIVRKAAM